MKYSTGRRLSKFPPELDPICDRCRQAPANLLHMFWTCPSLYNFWKLIFNTFSEIMGLPIDPSPFIAIFGVSYTCKMLAFCTLLARRLILLKWKNPFPPTFLHWIREIMQCLKLEKIRYSLQVSSQKFYGNLSCHLLKNTSREYSPKICIIVFFLCFFSLFLLSSLYNVIDTLCLMGKGLGWDMLV